MQTVYLPSRWWWAITPGIKRKNRNSSASKATSVYTPGFICLEFSCMPGPTKQSHPWMVINNDTSCNSLSLWYIVRKTKQTVEFHRQPYRRGGLLEYERRRYGGEYERLNKHNEHQAKCETNYTSHSGENHDWKQVPLSFDERVTLVDWKHQMLFQTGKTLTWVGINGHQKAKQLLESAHTRNTQNQCNKKRKRKKRSSQKSKGYCNPGNFSKLMNLVNWRIWNFISY